LVRVPHPSVPAVVAGDLEYEREFHWLEWVAIALYAVPLAPTRAFATKKLKMIGVNLRKLKAGVSGHA